MVDRQLMQSSNIRNSAITSVKLALKSSIHVKLAIELIHRWSIRRHKPCSVAMN